MASDDKDIRVNITYKSKDDSTGEVIDLDHTMGIFSDLSGKSKIEKPDIRDRKFKVITADTFDSVIEEIQPSVEFWVDNVIDSSADKKEKIKVILTFNSVDDFSPKNIVKNTGVPELNNLFELRNTLVELESYIDGERDAEDFLSNLLKHKNCKKYLKELMGETKPATE